MVKRQHFVPRVYLRKFINGSNALLFAKDTGKIDSDVFPVTPENICVQKHLYTFQFKDGRSNQIQALEKFYNVYFESDYNKTYDLLTDFGRNVISEDEHRLILGTILSFHFRVPKWYNQGEHVIEEFIDLIIEICETNPQIKLIGQNGQEWNVCQIGKDKLLSDLRNLNKFDFIKNQIKGLKSYLDHTLKNHQILFYKLHDSHEIFTGDVPVILNSGKPQVDEQITSSSHIMLPLDSKHYVVILPNGSKFDKIKKNQLHEKGSLYNMVLNNDHLYRNAERFIVGSKSGLDSFLEKYEDYKTNFNQIQKDAEYELEIEWLIRGFI